MTTNADLTLLRERIRPLDRRSMDEAARRQAELTKPAGSLGRLEDLAVQIAGITRDPIPAIPHLKCVIVMAADHGIAEEGVSAYPQEVTAQMVANFLRGGAAINVLARAVGARVVVVDMGIARELAAHPDLRVCRVGPGTKNFRRGPAMTRGEAETAIATGVQVLNAEAERGLDLVATGEMGIANTTAASTIVAALTGCAPAEAVGRGTGVDDATYERKIRVVVDALALHRPDPTDPVGVLASVGGFEIAGMVGLILAGAARSLPIVIDGFISGAAALAAVALAPECQPYLIAGHRSVEPGHRIVLDRLALRPLLELDLRLGEGSGAVLAMPIIDAALRIHREMATFTEANVSNRGQ